VVEGTENEHFTAQTQHINLTEIAIPGCILDIGGGGEGIIARRFGSQVVSIDKRKDELKESPDHGLKIIMDATDLKFLDATFDNVTCFYSLMYMTSDEIDTVLTEAYRVLKPGGALWIWDAIIPYPLTAEVFLAPLEVLVHGETVTPTYGVGRKEEQSVADIQQKCSNAGFIHVETKKSKQGFFMKLQHTK